MQAGAGDGIRTRDINLGKVALYQLSYSRLRRTFSFSPSPAAAVKSGFRSAAAYPVAIKGPEVLDFKNTRKTLTILIIEIYLFFYKLYLVC